LCLGESRRNRFIIARDCGGAGNCQRPGCKWGGSIRERPEKQLGRAGAEKPDPRNSLLEAAKKVLRQNGFSGLSTREVALAANMPLSQIHYHFGSKEGLVLALFEHLNAQLLDRQHALFGDPSLKLSEQWDLACQYLDEDIASGYVRVLQELWAAGYSNPRIAKVVRDGIMKWQELLTQVAGKAAARFGGMSQFTPKEIAVLVGTAFIGGEAYILLEMEGNEAPVQSALKKVGNLIRTLENPVSGSGES
jgi:AcrR family transcriptional regulator